MDSPAARYIHSGMRGTYTNGWESALQVRIALLTVDQTNLTVVTIGRRASAHALYLSLIHI